MSKKVLLARPHPFIVKEMKPLLDQCGYEVLKPENTSDMVAQAKSCDAAVISLAVVSNMGATAEEVLSEIHKANPKIPIIFASLLPFERVVSTISQMLDKVGIVARVIGASPTAASSSTKAGTLALYLSQGDLTDITARARAKQLLLRHIG